MFFPPGGNDNSTILKVGKQASWLWKSTKDLNKLLHCNLLALSKEHSRAVVIGDIEVLQALVLESEAGERVTLEMRLDGYIHGCSSGSKKLSQ